MIRAFYTDCRRNGWRCAVANLLPTSIVYWAVIRATVAAMGRDKAPDQVTPMDLLNAVDPRPHPFEGSVQFLTRRAYVQGYDKGVTDGQRLAGRSPYTETPGRAF